MIAAEVFTKAPATKQTAAQLVKAAAGLNALHMKSISSTTRPAIRITCTVNQQHQSLSKRHFSSTSKTSLKEYFPKPETSVQIRKTDPAWPHPHYTEKQMTENIKVAHRKPQDWSDWVALSMVKLLRWGTDLATGYHHDVEVPKKAADGKALVGTKPYRMSERKWLIRFVFLESVAGVPGMVAAMLRHLHSLRRLKRDNGWVETLLEEAYNERMHLLTFLKMAEPGLLMRAMVLGAQGVFFNGMFLAYLVSPRTCHRFVAYLEEEAVLTYSLAIRDLEAGRLPRWEGLQAPDLAVSYWDMPEGRRSMRDLLLYIRADEAKHREVNHTMGNLRQREDPNPFVSTYRDPARPHPSKGIENIRAEGWRRDEII